MRSHTITTRYQPGETKKQFNPFARYGLLPALLLCSQLMFSTAVHAVVIAADDLSSFTYDSGIGPWVGNWIEAGDDGNPTGGELLFRTLTNPLGTWIAFDEPGIKSLTRTVDLSGFDNTIVSVVWGCTGANNLVASSSSLQVSYNNGPFTTLATNNATLCLNNNSGSFSNIPLNPNIANTRIRFQGSTPDFFSSYLWNNLVIEGDVIEPVLTIDKDTTTPIGVAGGQASYDIVVTNNGSGATANEDVLITDTLPSGFSFSSASFTISGSATGPGGVTGGALTNNGSAAVPQFGGFTIPAGDSITITMVADIAGSQVGGVYSNVVTASSLSADFADATDDGTDTDEDVTLPFPNLSINKTTSTPGALETGETGTYTISVTNNGGTSAIVDITDALVGGATFVAVTNTTLSGGATGPNPATNSGTPTALSFDGYTLPINGGTVEIEFTINIDDAGSASGFTTLQNAATATETSGFAQSVTDDGSANDEDILLCANTATTYAILNTATVSSDTSNATAQECSIVDQSDDIDYGDLPDSYGTLLTSGGPSHIISDYNSNTNIANLMLGIIVDNETDGIPSANADGDDNVGSSNGEMAANAIVVNNSVTNGGQILDGINGNGARFNSTNDELILELLPGAASLASGTVITFTAFANNTTAKQIQIQQSNATGAITSNAITVGFNTATTSDFNFTGTSVETFTYTLVGDADHIRITMLERANSRINFDYMSFEVSTDDEDGVVFETFFGVPQIIATATVTNSTGSAAVVCGWLDRYDATGNPMGTLVAQDNADVCETAPVGVNDMVFEWTGLEQASGFTYARFRVCSIEAECNIPSAGQATDGEVEDYQVEFNFTPTAVTLGEFSVRAVKLVNMTTVLSREGLLSLLADWDPIFADGLRDSNASDDDIIDALRKWLDPDGDGAVAMLEWDTLEERGTVGFYVERMVNSSGDESNDESSEGDWLVINDQMIPALVFAPLGAQYILFDPGAQGNQTHQYRLIEQESSGNTLEYGPFKVTLK